MSLKGALPDAFDEKIVFLVKNLFDFWIITGFVGALIAGLSWMAAMTKMELSYAYPFVSITFPAVVILSGFFFHEPITMYKYIGLLLIVVGVIVTSQG
jgi:drug/metabolite transporter (DMT)-like permease